MAKDVGALSAVLGLGGPEARRVAEQVLLKRIASDKVRDVHLLWSAGVKLEETEGSPGLQRPPCSHRTFHPELLRRAPRHALPREHDV